MKVSVLDNWLRVEHQGKNDGLWVCNSFEYWFKREFAGQTPSLARVWNALEVVSWMVFFLDDRMTGRGKVLADILRQSPSEYPILMCDREVWPEGCRALRLAMPGNVLEALVAEYMVGGSS